MQTELLFRILSQIRPLPAGVRRAVETCLHEETYSCDKILVRNNAVVFKIWFMVEGFARAYRERDQKEETLWFAGKGEFFTADRSFFKQHPSEMTIKVYRNSTLLAIGFNDLLELKKNHPEFAGIYSSLLESYHLCEQERMWERMYDKPEKRLEKLLRRHPQILLKVNQATLASYLSISRRTLSTLLSKR